MAENLGIFFIMFQSQLNDFVKCWFDGNEDYEIYHINDFIELVVKIGNIELTRRVSDYVSTSSIYLIDVLSQTVKRLSPSADISNIGELAIKAKETNKNIKSNTGVYYDETSGKILYDV